MTISNWQVVIECLEKGSIFVKSGTNSIETIVKNVERDTKIPVEYYPTSMENIYQLKIKVQ